MEVTTTGSGTGRRPMRWGRGLGAIVVIGLVLFGSVASATASHRHTLRVIGHATDYTTTQADPTGNVFAPGDENFLGGTLLRYASPHDEIGTAALHCAATGAGGSGLLCDAGFTLPGGMIMTQALFGVTTDWVAPTRKLAITGGTGKYRHARGELIVSSLPSGDETFTFVFD